MKTYTVLSLDMRGHVPADCCGAYECPCVNEAGEHDDNACECHEDMNASYKCGTLEVEDTSDADILDALLVAGYLTPHGRMIADVDDYSDGSQFDIVDSDGRKLFSLRHDEDA
jgi:hypothetical protein